MIEYITESVGILRQHIATRASPYDVDCGPDAVIQASPLIATSVQPSSAASFFPIANCSSEISLGAVWLVSFSRFFARQGQDEVPRALWTQECNLRKGMHMWRGVWPFLLKGGLRIRSLLESISRNAEFCKWVGEGMLAEDHAQHVRTGACRGSPALTSKESPPGAHLY